jgi:hypothetical protein
MSSEQSNGDMSSDVPQEFNPNNEPNVIENISDISEEEITSKFESQI